MRIQYTGEARVRVDGVGYFEPGEEREVDDEIARALTGEEFKPVQSAVSTEYTGPVGSPKKGRRKKKNLGT
jgi:hypothetical protein